MDNIREVQKKKKFILIGVAIAVLTLLIVGGVYINHQQNEKEQAKIEAQEKKDAEKKAAQEAEEKAKAEAEKLKAEQEAKKAEEEKNKIEEMAVIYYSKGNQDVYSEKENKGKKLVTLVDAQAIQITGKTQDGYYRVDWMGDVGYMKVETLSDTNPAEAVANNSASSNGGSSSNSGTTSSGSSNSGSSNSGSSSSGGSSSNSGSSSGGNSSNSGSSSSGGSSNSGSAGGSTGGSTAPAAGYNPSATQEFNAYLTNHYFTQLVGGTHYNMLMAYINNGTPVQAGVCEDTFKTTGKVTTAQITYPYKSSYGNDEIGQIYRANFSTTANGVDGGWTNYFIVTNNGNNTVTIKMYHLGVEDNF